MPSAAALGEELASLKQHLDEGLLTQEQYKACVDSAIAKYKHQDEENAAGGDKSRKGRGLPPSTPRNSAPGGGGQYRRLPGEPGGPVVRQEPTELLPQFEPEEDRTASYRGPVGQQLLRRLREVVSGLGEGDHFLAAVIADLCQKEEDARRFESVLGNLSPQAFSAFISNVQGDVKIVKELKEGAYQPQWYISLKS